MNIKQESDGYKKAQEDTLIKIKSNEKQVIEIGDKLKLTEAKLEDT